MKGKNQFSKKEAAEIRILIEEKLKAEKNKQKQIREKIRKLGFYFTDFYTRKDRYDILAFDNLIKSKRIVIIEIKFPIDIFKYDIKRLFESIEHPESFKDAFNNGLSSEIDYIYTHDRIANVAELHSSYDKDKPIYDNDAKIQQIRIYNNFCQFIGL